MSKNIPLIAFALVASMAGAVLFGAPASMKVS
jgi:hypothetical protein